MLQQETVTDKLLQEIKELNKDFYGNIILEWYVNPNIYTAKCICYRNKQKQLKGYILVTCISKLYYQALVKGVYTDELDTNYILYVPNSAYWYITSVVIAKEEQHKGIATQLLAYLLQYPFEHICAITVTKEGNLLFSKYLNKIEQLSEECFIFENVKV